MRLGITSNYSIKYTVHITVVRLQSVYSRVGTKAEIYPKNKPRFTHSSHL